MQPNADISIDDDVDDWGEEKEIKDRVDGADPDDAPDEPGSDEEQWAEYDKNYHETDDLGLRLLGKLTIGCAFGQPVFLARGD